jgi:anti-sigma B factor antagonist
MPEASFPVEMVAGAAVVTTPEEIDIGNAAGLRAALLEAATHQPGVLVIDMTQTEFCDSAGLNVLVRAYQGARDNGSELRLVISGAAVLRIFAVTGLDRTIPTFLSRSEALARTPDTTIPTPPAS